MNTAAIQGNVTRDGEIRFLSSGTQVTEFGVAVNRRTKKNGEWVDVTDFFDVQYWGKKVVSRGDAVLVHGELRQDVWEKDGQKRSKVYINANDITVFTGYKKTVKAEEPQTEETTSDSAGEDIPF
jgi:single-strand DNA-binding protein